MSIDYQKLRDPFTPNEIEWRVGRAGISNNKPWAKVLAYVQSRAVMARLDDVCGPANWSVKYEFVDGRPPTLNSKGDIIDEGISAGVLCYLSIYTPSGWVTKQDGAEQTDIESFKGGLSSAFKRAAVAWGIGRYLYDLEEGFANIVEKGTKGAQYSTTKDKKTGQYIDFYWIPPQLPEWATPKGVRSTTTLPQGYVIDESKLNQDKPESSVVAKETTSPDRMELNKKMMNLYKPYMQKYPDTQVALLLAEKYGVKETRLLTIEQLADFVRYIESRLK